LIKLSHITWRIIIIVTAQNVWIIFCSKSAPADISGRGTFRPRSKSRYIGPWTKRVKPSQHSSDDVLCAVTNKTHFSHAVKVCKRSRAIAGLIRNIGARCWSHSRPGRFNPGKELRYALNRMLGGARAGLDELVRKKTWDRPAISIFTIPTELSQLLTSSNAQHKELLVP
jgi:hypothetical protein